MPGLELDDAALERLREHPRGAEDRMPGEGHLVARVEDADARVAARLRRHEERRLREADLLAQCLHQLARPPRARR